MICADTEQDDLALEHLSTMIEMWPNDTNARALRALIHLERGNHEQYRRECEQAVEQLSTEGLGVKYADQPYFVSWICCLAPDVVVDYSPLLRWAEEFALSTHKSNFATRR